MAEQEDLEHQLNNVSDDDLLLGGDDGSELEESELSVSDYSSNVHLEIFDLVVDNENFELFYVDAR